MIREYFPHSSGSSWSRDITFIGHDLNKKWRVTYRFVLRQLNDLWVVAFQRIRVSRLLRNVGPFQRGKGSERLAYFDILSFHFCVLCERRSRGGKAHKPSGGSDDPARAATLTGTQAGCSGEKFSTKRYHSPFGPQTLVGFVTSKRTTFGLSDNGPQERRRCI